MDCISSKEQLEALDPYQKIAVVRCQTHRQDTCWIFTDEFQEFVDADRAADHFWDGQPEAEENGETTPCLTIDVEITNVRDHLAGRDGVHEGFDISCGG